MSKKQMINLALSVGWWCAAFAVLLSLLDWIDGGDRHDGGPGDDGPGPEIIPPDPGERILTPRHEPEIAKRMHEAAT